VKKNIIKNNFVATHDTVIDITDENLIQITNGILNPTQFVKNNKILIKITPGFQ
jgi:hypothetical protein